MRIMLLALTMVIGLSGCASSPPDAASGTTAATSAGAGSTGDAAAGEAAPKTKLVCHRERGTGSRLSAQRLCKEVPIE